MKDTVLDELHKLPNQFTILRNKFLHLRYAVTHPRTSEPVKSCQIDYLVIGPTGIFIIEAKNWDEELYTQKVPHIEADKAGLVVLIKVKDYLKKRKKKKYVPISNIVATLNPTSFIQYGRVSQLFAWQLKNYIAIQENRLSKSEIRKIRRLFRRRK